MAAVHATPKIPAVVCVLGTGSNCCYFNGTSIHSKAPSLGFLVMDEVSERLRKRAFKSLL